MDTQSTLKTGENQGGNSLPTPQEDSEELERAKRKLELSKGLQTRAAQGLKALDPETLSARDIVALMELGLRLEREAVEERDAIAVTVLM